MYGFRPSSVLSRLRPNISVRFDWFVYRPIACFVSLVRSKEHHGRLQQMEKHRSTSMQCFGVLASSNLRVFLFFLYFVSDRYRTTKMKHIPTSIRLRCFAGDTRLALSAWRRSNANNKNWKSRKNRKTVYFVQFFALVVSLNRVLAFLVFKRSWRRPKTSWRPNKTDKTKRNSKTPWARSLSRNKSWKNAKKSSKPKKRFETELRE